MAGQDTHPFMSWLAVQKRMGAMEAEGKDVILGDGASRRFALGLHEGRPLLCWHPADEAALQSIRWTSAAIAYGLRGRDWIALSASDARVRDSSALNPVPVRLFIPVTAGRLDAWQAAKPSAMAVGTMSSAGPSPSFAGAPWKELPLKLLGASELPQKAMAGA